MIRIAIIDSGVDSRFIHLANSKGIGIIEKQGKIVTSDDFGDNLGHGTACYGIIRRLGPDAEYFHVKIFKDKLRSKEGVLEEAIQAAIESKPQIINISLGILTEKAHKQNSLYEACKKAFEQNILIVAASQNRNMDAYPAVFSEVLVAVPGVCKKQGCFHYCPTKWYVTNSGPQVLDWLDNAKVFSGGTSFAAARLTANIANLISQEGLENNREVIKVLNKQSEPCSCQMACPRNISINTESMSLKATSMEAKELKELILQGIDKQLISDDHLIINGFTASFLANLVSRRSSRAAYDLSLSDFTDINNLSMLMASI